MNEQSRDRSENEMSEELLEQALASIQRQAAPAGPPPRLVADTLAALQDFERPLPRFLPFVFRTKIMKFTATAAALLLTASIAILLIPAMKSPSSAFGQVIKQVRAARSMSYTQLIKVDGNEQLITTKNFIAEDGRRRTEQPGAGGLTTIFDTNGFIRLTLIEPTKTALVREAREERAVNAGQMFLEWLQALKKLGDKPDKELGQKELDGRRVTGFIATQGNFTFTMWVDSATGELVRIEHDLPVNDNSAHITMTDFRFNESLDESLFSFAVPAGYKVHQSTGAPSLRDVTIDGETNVIEALRGYAKRDAGKFPPSLTDWGPWAVLFSKDNQGGTPDPEATRVMGHLGAMLPFLTPMPKEDYAYLGKGKSVDDKDAIIFWYRKPDDTIRAIYGDLSVKDIAAEELPKN
jgi:outer membrane lipoprotein-sorting protein